MVRNPHWPCSLLHIPHLPPPPCCPGTGLHSACLSAGEGLQVGGRAESSGVPTHPLAFVGPEIQGGKRDEVGNTLRNKKTLGSMVS